MQIQYVPEKQGQLRNQRINENCLDSNQNMEMSYQIPCNLGSIRNTK